jgi:hypothetical protein
MNTSRPALSIFVVAALPLSPRQRNRPPMQALLDAHTHIRDVVSRRLADAEAGKPRDIRVGDIYAIGSSIVETKCMEIGAGSARRRVAHHVEGRFCSTTMPTRGLLVRSRRSCMIPESAFFRTSSARESLTESTNSPAFSRTDPARNSRT